MNPLEQWQENFYGGQMVDCETATHVHSGTGLCICHFCMQKFSPQEAAQHWQLDGQMTTESMDLMQVAMIGYAWVESHLLCFYSHSILIFPHVFKTNSEESHDKGRKYHAFARIHQSLFNSRCFSGPN